jgi:hypothetical protein
VFLSAKFFLSCIVLALFRLSFSASSVFYKSYRQVLTLIDNLQHHLRLPIFDKTRLVALNKKAKQRNYTNWFLPDRDNESAHDLDSLRDHKRLLQTDC